MSNQTSAVLALCSAPDKAVARLLSQHLLDARLAACVSVLPGMHSMYHWEGRIEAADEVLMLIKTTSNQLEEMQRVIREIHPYDVPELVCLDISETLPDYLAWIRSITDPG